MHAAKEKVSNIASAAKEKVKMCTARGEEKAEMATARTAEERAIAHERRKAKEAEAKMELHEEKVMHAGQKLDSKIYSSSRYQPVAPPAWDCRSL